MKSVFGLDENLAGALCYLLGWISGIVVLVMEKDNKFVRFHALQSTLWFLLLMVVGWGVGLMSRLPFIGGFWGVILWPVTGLLGLVGVVSWIILMIKAHAGEKFKIPIIGDVVLKQVDK